MQPVDNSQFTEEQRTEAYRREHMAQVIRQTKALESIRSIMVVFTILFVVGVVMWIAMVASTSHSGL
jgi:hypothetical protein